MRFRFPFRSPRIRGRDLLRELREWCHQDMARPDLSARFEQLRAEVELPSLGELSERLRREAYGGALASAFDRLDRGRAKRSMRKLLRELQDESEWPRLNALADRLQTEIELPDLPELPALNGQQRQALKGLMLLGMVLHTMPVRVPESGPLAASGSATVTETLTADAHAATATEAAQSATVSVPFPVPGSARTIASEPAVALRSADVPRLSGQDFSRAHAPRGPPARIL